MRYSHSDAAFRRKLREIQLRTQGMFTPCGKQIPCLHGRVRMTNPALVSWITSDLLIFLLLWLTPSIQWSGLQSTVILIEQAGQQHRSIFV